MPISAFFLGILGASSLALGAIFGVATKPHPSISAAIMAFGSGTLLSAIAFEITRKVYLETNFMILALGFATGGIMFTQLSHYIDQHGGFLRKTASSRRYLAEYRQDINREILKRIAHVEVLRDLPEEEKAAIATLVTPICVREGEILCCEGEAGDFCYMIASGEALVKKGDRLVATLGAGDIVGEMSLLTGEPRSATVITQTPMELYQLNRDNFGTVLNHSPRLLKALSRTLARRLGQALNQQSDPSQSLDYWQKQLLEPIALDQLLREDKQILEKLVQRSAPLAILVGTCLDNIPEAAVIGMNSGSQQLGWAFLVAVFISNFPEAFSSAAGMKQAGTSNRLILLLWFGIVFLSGFIAMGGFWLQDHTSTMVIAFSQAIAGGAILAMLASTMMPEAYELGGSTVAYSTIAGFLLGFLVTALSS